MAHPVVGLHVQQQRGDHGDGLLAGDGAGIILADDQLVDLLQDGQLAQLRAAECHVPAQRVRVPRQRPGRL